jgi:hypothetical protein
MSEPDAQEITFEEKIESRSIQTDEYGNLKSAEFIYLLRGTSDEALALQTTFDNTKSSYTGEGNTLFRSSVKVDPVYVDAITNTGIWTVTVDYAPVSPAQQAASVSVISFDTTGGTQHIQHSIETRSPQHVAGGGVAPLFGGLGEGQGGGAIGVTSDGNVEGVDITVPVYTWSEMREFTDAQVAEYRPHWYSLTGTVNNAAFKGFAAGEVLFGGVSGSKRTEGSTEGKWEVTAKFSGSPNRTGIKIDVMTNIEKKGWDYMWVLYQPYEHSSASSLVRRAKAVYIEKVYQDGDHSLLGFGTT